MMKNLGAEHENLDHKAYEIVKNMIIDRSLLPGEKISQEKLAMDLGISRTPLVSALKYLEIEKLVEAKPRRGFFVRHFTKQEMISIFELREVLEGLAARRAALNITDPQIAKLNAFFQQFAKIMNITDYKAYAREDRRFHNFVTEVGSREFLKSILETYNIVSFSYQVVSSEGLVRAPNDTIHEHLAVIKAISNRDSDAAEELMRLHLKKSIAILKQDIKAGNEQTAKSA
ncbi:MAG: GntR family transcriptional regulator [Planctomycetota bacterium]|jgi:DNA-binding GntR family transcriptional regulator